MTRSALLRSAAVLSLITCVGHTIGTFMPVPAEQAQMHATIAFRYFFPVPGVFTGVATLLALLALGRHPSPEAIGK